MPLNVTLEDAILRIGLAFVGAALIGFNRGERNEAAGMRTTILVCMAACLATLLANLLLDTTGKDQHHFTQMDVLRLPLGVLSGIGFIGAGAIIKKGDIALGVTTAATMWFMTVVGICFGAGQLILGAVGVALALSILWLLKWFDVRMKRAMRANLKMNWHSDSVDGEGVVRRTLEAHRYEIISLSIAAKDNEHCMDVTVQWEGRQEDAAKKPLMLEDLQRQTKGDISWSPAASPF